MLTYEYKKSDIILTVRFAGCCYMYCQILCCFLMISFFILRLVQMVFICNPWDKFMFTFHFDSTTEGHIFWYVIYMIVVV